MTYLERIMRDLRTTIGEQQAVGKKRKARKSTRADGTNPRANGSNPRAVGTNPKAISLQVKAGNHEKRH